jgi:hypothetical protein
MCFLIETLVFLFSDFKRFPRKAPRAILQAFPGLVAAIFAGGFFPADPRYFE